MSAIRRSLTAGMALGLLLCGTWTDSLAGVAARTDGRGKYVGARLTPDAEGARNGVWDPGDTPVPGIASLNPRGDLNGDLWPTVAESSVAPHYPWVVWSRFNGTDYDLAWSRWQGRDWEPIRWVEEQTTAGDDLDADLAFDWKGKPYLTWWREDEGVGEVYLRVFLLNRWSDAFRISPQGVDARYPTLAVYSQGRIVVEYETAAGIVQQTVLFSQPMTITDDINPLTAFRLGTAVLVHRRDR